MAKRVVLIADDITGKATPEEELKPIEYTHPLDNRVYVLMTTDENMAGFLAKMDKETAKLTETRKALDEAYSNARREADAAYKAMVDKANEDRQTALDVIGDPFMTAIRKNAKGYDDWEAKKSPGRPAGGTGDPQRAADIAIGKARAAFINSEQAMELGGAQMRPFIKARRSKPKGRISETLMDWLMSEDIRPVWWPEGMDQPTLV